MKYFLNNAYPNESTKINLTEISLIPNKYVKGNKINNIRNHITRNTLISRMDDKTRPLNVKGYVLGPIGSIARYDLSNKNSPLETPIDIDTTLDMSNCKSHEKIVACLFPPSKLFVVDGKKAYKRSLPDGIVADTIRILDKQKLMLIDKAGSIFVSRNAGVSWTTAHKSTVSRQPQFAANEYLNNYGSESYGVYLGPDKYYVYANSREKSGNFGIWESDSKLKSFSAISLPESIRDIPSILESNDTLVISPRIENLFNEEFYIRTSDGKTWRTVDTPGRRCGALKVSESDPNTMSLICSGRTWKTTDGAKTWKASNKLDKG
ncbi:MAG: hypothetical protein OEZ43_07695 [Gammaproteobacteria bacterium]|nr:hypothetical protein [Gammaproteobacteria bacterium]